jgi:hypothetical protein
MTAQDYEKELMGALSNLKAMAAQMQTALGVVESMLWLIRKEREKPEEKGA